MRSAALQGIDWPGARKAQVHQVLNLDFMSSDEEDGSPRKLRRRLSWGSTRLRTEKEALDTFYLDGIKDGRVKNAMTRYKGDGSISDRTLPNNAPIWAVDFWNCMIDIVILILDSYTITYITCDLLSIMCHCVTIWIFLIIVMLSSYVSSCDRIKPNTVHILRTLVGFLSLGLDTNKYTYTGCSAPHVNDNSSSDANAKFCICYYNV